MNKVAWLTLPMILAGCNAAPAQDVMGSFFPAWILCAVIGITLAAIVRYGFVAAGINTYLWAPLLTYSAIALSAALLIWLLWFGN